MAYTALDWSVQVMRYTAAADHPESVDAATAETILSGPSSRNISRRHARVWC
ncbi:MAG: hypothetical protein JOZ87_25680 [Chloroflexi bacterium]|nr:hypothetical protein [Chloroflexota bacterium]